MESSHKNHHEDSTSASQATSSDTAPFRYLDLAPELRQRILSAFLEDCKILAGAYGKHTVIPAKLRLVSRTFTEDAEEAFKGWKVPEKPVYRILTLRSVGDIPTGKLPYEVAASGKPYKKIAFDVVEFVCFHWTAVRCMVGHRWDDGFDKCTREGLLVTLPDKLLRAYNAPDLTMFAKDVMVGWRIFWHYLQMSGKVIPVVRVDLRNWFHKVLSGADRCYLKSEWWSPSISRLLCYQGEGLVQKVEIVGLPDEELEIYKQDFEFAYSKVEGTSAAIENGVLTVVQLNDDGA